MVKLNLTHTYNQSFIFTTHSGFLCVFHYLDSGCTSKPQKPFILTLGKPKITIIQYFNFVPDLFFVSCVQFAQKFLSLSVIIFCFLRQLFFLLIILNLIYLIIMIHLVLIIYVYRLIYMYLYLLFYLFNKYD